MSRIRRINSQIRPLGRFSDFGAIRRYVAMPRVKQNFRRIRDPMSPTTLLAELTLKRRCLFKKQVMLAITYSPAQCECT